MKSGVEFGFGLGWEVVLAGGNGLGDRISWRLTLRILDFWRGGQKSEKIIKV